MKQLIAPLVLGVLLSCGSNASGSDRPATRVQEPIVGLPCEGCKAVFQGMPDSLAWHSRIAPLTEPGVPMQIEGTVRDPTGRATSGVIVYAYQTNARGIYPPDDAFRGQAAHRHGRLRAWARTDSRGRYRFDTIRPAGYPDTNLPAHVHMHIVEVGCCTYYIDDILFDDDPRLTEAMRGQLTLGRGGNGITTPEPDTSGTWMVTRDIVLGERIPDYPDASP